MNSSTLMGLEYRIAGCWGSHETSMLFWTSSASILSLIYAYGTKFKDQASLYINNIISITFVFYIFIFANPFIQTSAQIKEGLGMNTSLQDSGMMIHPPMLLFSYALMQLIYSVNLGAVITGNIHSNIILLYLIRTAFGLLTLAISLGGWWAYRELGWGGYWFFDPVENISLLTWILFFVYHHNFIPFPSSPKNYLLGMMPFLSVIFGTYLVRSGLLNSIHSFAESSGAIIILFIASCASIPFFYLLYKNTETHYPSKLIRVGKYFWLTSAGVILISLIVPIFSPVSFEISPGFFYSTLMPLMLASSSFAGLVYFGHDYVKNIIFLTIHIQIFMILYFGIKVGFLYSLAYSCGLWIFNTSFIGLLRSAIGKSLGPKRLSMFLGHISIGLFILSISFNNHFRESHNFILTPKEEVMFRKNIHLTLEDVEYGHGGNYLEQKARIKLSWSIPIIAYLTPSLRYYPIEKSLSSEVSIFSTKYGDWYSVINNAQNDTISVEISYQPAIGLIWISVILCVCSILMRNFTK
ncbi:MAG: cytochrome c biogenesis protein CcsA [Rickettsiaceae bacterium]|nr:cytochrome c biogenesis protein CcsA [Rickettsiaceae bacterium]